jgi:hypothetical protein
MWTFLMLFVLVSLMAFACRLGGSSSGANPPSITNTPGKSSKPSSGLTPSTRTVASIGLPAPSQTATSADLTEANLPAGFPLYPGGHDYSWVPGLLVKYTVDVDVSTASGFYTAQMEAGGYSDLSPGGGITGECGGSDCGAVPTNTPGPTPTSTPEGWLASTDQVWMKGSEQIVINYKAKSDGTTEISIMFVSK